MAGNKHFLGKYIGFMVDEIPNNDQTPTTVKSEHIYIFLNWTQSWRKWDLCDWTVSSNAGPWTSIITYS
jgi:hypothetical protein